MEGRRCHRAFVLACALCVGCVHQRDFRSRAERITTRTAYTLRPQEARADVGLVGDGLHDFGAIVGIRGAPTRRWEIGFNAAHAALGILSVDTKVNLLDNRIAGLGLAAGLLYTNPKTLYVLPKDLREKLGDINLVVLPITLNASFPVARWVGLHLTMGYTHAQISGRYRQDSFLVDGGLGSRDLFFEPQVIFYAGQRVALFLRAHLSAMSRSFAVAQGTVVLEPGIELGLLTSRWRRAPFSATSQYAGGIEVRFGRSTHMVASLTVGRLKPFVRPSIMPSLLFYWRFGRQQ